MAEAHFWSPLVRKGSSGLQVHSCSGKGPRLFCVLVGGGCWFWEVLGKGFGQHAVAVKVVSTQHASGWKKKVPVVRCGHS